VRRVERQVGAAGLEHAERGDHQLGRALQAQADPRLGPDPQGLKVARQPAGTFAELAVREAALLGGDGGGFGGARCVRLDQLVQAEVPGQG
jgi:hypothetical protein